MSGETRHPQNGEAFLSGDMVVTDSRCPAEPGETCNTSAPILVPAPPPEGAEDRSSSEGAAPSFVDPVFDNGCRQRQDGPNGSLWECIGQHGHNDDCIVQQVPHDAPAAPPERPDWWQSGSRVAWVRDGTYPNGAPFEPIARSLARQVDALQEALRWALLNGNGPTEEALSPEARWALHTTLNTQEDTST